MKKNINDISKAKLNLEKKMQARFPKCIMTTIVTFWQDNTFQVCVQSYDNNEELPYRRYWYKSQTGRILYEECETAVPFSK